MSVLEIPSDIYPSTMSFGLERADDILEGYGMTQRVEVGNARWRATLTWDGIASDDGTREQAQRLAAWLDEASRADALAIIRDRAYTPQGSWGGVPYVNGGGQTGSSLVIAGGVASQTVAKRGDYFVVSGQLKRVTRDCILDASGIGRIYFEPKLVASPSNGALLYTSEPWCAMYLPARGHAQSHRPPTFSSTSVDFVDPVVDPGENDGPYIDLVRANGVGGAISPLVTHSRASCGYYLGPDGYTHDAQNLCLRSEDFTHAAWATYGSVSVTANTAVAPDGTTTADTISDATAAAYSGVYQTITVGNDRRAYCASVYIRKKTASVGHRVMFYTAIAGGAGVNAYVILDPFNGAYIGAGVTYGVEDCGNYWRVFAVVANNASGNTSLTIEIYPAFRSDLAGPGSDVAVTGSIEAWGAMVNRGRRPGYYVGTTTVALGAKRLEWNSAGNCLGMLTEASRTNYELRSEEFDNANWTKTNTTVSADNGASPMGCTTADKVIAAATNTQHYVSGTSAVADGSAAAISVYAKAAGETKLVISVSGSSTYAATFDLSAVTATSAGGAGISCSIKSVGNGWYRCMLVSTGTIGFNKTPYFFIRQYAAWTGNASDGLLLWGAQNEISEVPSSYIPTTSANATRSADIYTATATALGLNELEYSVLSEHDYSNLGSSAFASNRVIWEVSDGTSNNRLLHYNNSGADGFYEIISGSTNPLSNVISSVAADTMVTTVTGVAVNNFKSVKSDAASLTDTTNVPLPRGMITLTIGSLFGHHKRLRVYPQRRLTNTELSTLAVTT